MTYFLFYYFLFKINGCNPERIFIYRDGVGDGQLDTVANYEVKQLLDAFSSIDETYKPRLTVIVVQKRINTRLLAMLVRIPMISKKK